MDQANSKDDFLSAWSALDSPDSVEKDGWRTIPLDASLSQPLLAGRSFPGNEEAVLIGFRTAPIPPTDQLPESRGFHLYRVDPAPELPFSKVYTWVAICCRSKDHIEMFGLMIHDLVANLSDHRSDSERVQLGILLSRVKAWQNFMNRTNQSVLSVERQVGLIGELLVLQSLIGCGLPPATSVGSWVGPMDALHDFVLSGGVIEVKTSLGSGPFVARISSLEQLDTEAVAPIYLATVSLAAAPEGLSLWDTILATRELVRSDPQALVDLNVKVLNAGFADSFSQSYQRRFAHNGTVLLLVSDDLPRLTRATVPANVPHAEYDLDLSTARAENNIPIQQVLVELGVAN